MVKFILGLGLTNATNIFNKIGLFIAETKVKIDNSENLGKVIYIFLYKFPFIDKYLESSVKGLNVYNVPYKSILKGIKCTLEDI